MRICSLFCFIFFAAVTSFALQSPPPLNVIIRNATLYDGSGSPPLHVDIGLRGDTIAAVGKLPPGAGRTEIDARGLSVAPGFINMLSHSEESLIADGRSQGEIREGVTLEVLGE